MIPIPPEITDLIIKQTQAGLVSHSLDWKTLASCSLFLALLETSPHLGGAIHSESPSICNKAELNFLSAFDEVDLDKPIHIPPPPEDKPISPVLLMKIAAALSPKARLTLYPIIVLGWPSDTPLPTAPVKLHALSIVGVIFNPFALPYTKAFDISSFFELDEIDFAGTELAVSATNNGPLDILTLPLITRPIARCVKVGVADCFAVYNIQCGGFCPGYLETLRCDPEDLDTLKMCGKLFRLHGGSVRNVELAVSPVLAASHPKDLAGFWQALSIPACTRLETLHFSWAHRGIAGIVPLAARMQDIEACESFRVILASTSRTLRKLSFDLASVCKKPADTLTDTLQCLAPRIEGSFGTFPNLKTITLTFSRAFPAGECTRVIRSTLPTNLLDSGRLLVNHQFYRARRIVPV